jgi:hypothetical protein
MQISNSRMSLKHFEEESSTSDVEDKKEKMSQRRGSIQSIISKRGSIFKASEYTGSRRRSLFHLFDDSDRLDNGYNHNSLPQD